jgi:hypothetical protein
VKVSSCQCMLGQVVLVQVRTSYYRLGLVAHVKPVRSG